MLAKLFDRIIQESKAEFLKDGDRFYCQKDLKSMKNRPVGISMHTLTGLEQFLSKEIHSRMTPDLAFCVSGPDMVSLLSYDHIWNEYFPLATAHCFKSNNPFRFGEKYDIETFIVRLQAEFGETFDRHELLKLVSSLTSGATKTNEDDGISQKVIVKKGITLRDEKVVNPRVALMPYRTFQEVDQPISNYIFRVYSEGAEPKVALHEAEGGQWQYEAVKNIVKYLETITITSGIKIFY